MLSRIRVMLLVVMAAAPAHAMVTGDAGARQEAAPVSEIAVGTPDDARVSVVGVIAEAREVDETSVVTLQLQLDGPLDPRTGRMALKLPEGAEVVGMTFARGGESLRASVRDTVEASEAFEQTRLIKKDPALLEWKDQSEMELAMYPVVAGERPTATLTITMPRFRVLRVHAGGMHRELDGAKLEPGTTEDIAFAHQAPMVTSGVSLLAMPPPSIDDFDVRLANNQAEIDTCSRLSDRDGPRDVTLVVVVGADGNVSEATAGDSPAGACAAHLASTWRFGAGPRPISMHLRLHLSA